MKKSKNEAKLAYDSSISSNKKSSNTLRLMSLLANLSPKLAEIASISMFMIQCINNGANFYKNRFWSRERLNLESCPRELVSSI